MKDWKQKLIVSLWKDGFDTLSIAEWVESSEAEVYNFLAKKRDVAADMKGPTWRVYPKPIGTN